MKRPVLLIDLGGDPLPVTTPAVPRVADWAPAIYAAPPVPTPGGLSVALVVGGVRLTWSAVAIGEVRYEVERAPDAAGAPGAAARVATLDDTSYNSNETARTHWRVRANVRGRVSGWSAWVAQSPGTLANLPGTLDDVQDGSAYGRFSPLDGVNTNGVRRIGLAIRGSGHQLGGPRNLPANQIMGYSSVRSATALTGTAAGAVNVNAHDVLLNGETVSYAAVTNAVTGLTQGSTYVIYTFDPLLEGGARAWFASINPLTAQQQAAGVVIAGQVKIPTSGNSGGGGGGGGSNPGDWCVDADSVLPDGDGVAMLERGRALPCYNNRPEAPDLVHLPIRAIAFAAGVECLRLITTSGASVVASTTTPMTLRNGASVLLPEMLGLEALVYRLGGGCVWETVVALIPVGRRRVAKINVSNQCYFAAEHPGAYIATHNITNVKP